MNQILSFVNDFIQAKEFSKACFLQGLCTRDEMLRGIHDKRWETVGKIMDLGLDEFPARAIISDFETDEKEEIL